MENPSIQKGKKLSLAIAIAAVVSVTACQQSEGVAENEAALKIQMRSKPIGNLFNYISKIGDIAKRDSIAEEELSHGVASIVMSAAQQTIKSDTSEFSSVKGMDAEGKTGERKLSGRESMAKKETAEALPMSLPEVSSSAYRTELEVAEADIAGSISASEVRSSKHIERSGAERTIADGEVMVSERHKTYPRKPQYYARSGILTAGDIDDNLNITHFTQYLSRMMNQDQLTARYQANYPFVDYSGVAQFYLKDKLGKAVSHTRFDIVNSSNRKLYSSYTGYNGLFTLLPVEHGLLGQQQLAVRLYLSNGETLLFKIPQQYTDQNLQDLHVMTDISVFDVQLKEHVQGDVSKLDLMFVVDTTGSMSDELSYLQAELNSMINSLKQRYQGLDLRIALVFYRDKGDRYQVRNYRFNRDADLVRNVLADQKAQGGGDYPEAMELALASAVNQQWRAESDVARMMFLLADAPPHVEKMQASLHQIFNLRKKGIHLYPIAASGAAEESEYLMRLGAQLTHGRYLFLTDDAGVGNAHAEPKVACYQVTQLNNLMKRVIAAELSGQRVEASDANVIRSVGHYQEGECL